MTDLVKLCESILLAPYQSQAAETYEARSPSSGVLRAATKQEHQSRVCPLCEGGYRWYRDNEDEWRERCGLCSGHGILPGDSV